MKINVVAKPGAGQELVEDLGDNKYKVWIREPASKGSANKALVYVLAKHFGVAQSCVRIVRGHASHNKLVEITN